MKAKNKDTLVISLYAGPGCGKSTIMAGVFAELKWRGVNVEMAPEFAKEKVWENSLDVLENQIYVFGKQLHTIVRVAGQVDVVITDSPLLLSIIYGKNQVPEFKPFVIAVNAQFRMKNFFLCRHKKYQEAGRLHNEDEAKQIDNQIESLLNEVGVQFDYVAANKDAVTTIVGAVLTELGMDHDI